MFFFYLERTTMTQLADPYGLLRPAGTPPTILGRTEPRIWTPPLRELTPETSYGFDVCDYAKEIDHPLDPWQEWLVIHAGEELPDGSPRFTRVLVLVSRQQGKTLVLKVLTLYWLFDEVYETPGLILGTSTNLGNAVDVWREVKDIIEDKPALRAQIPRGKGQGYREATGQQTIQTVHKTIYKVAASNRRGGRGKTIRRLMCDEVREHDDWDAYNAAWPACSRWDSQAWFLSNQGDDNAVVLDSLREQAIKFIKTGEGDPQLGIFEWSAPDGSEIDDVEALAQANPNLNRRGKSLAQFLFEARAIKEKGDPVAIADFKTEKLCMKVPKLDAAIDPMGWAACGTDNPTPIDTWRNLVALCFDVSLDWTHATLMGAVFVDGIVHLEPIEEWASTAALKRELRPLVAKVRPRAVGWLPGGPAASVMAEMTGPSQAKAWPRGVVLQEIRGEATAVCMGFSELVTSGHVRHPNDPVVNAHVAQAEKMWRGDAWVFARKGSEPIDATYASAGAAHLARTLPVPVGKPRIILPKPE
jgi:hypothetical protein